MSTPTDILSTAYTRTARMDIHDIAQELIDNLGPTLVAVIGGVKDKKLPYKWANKKNPVTPRDATIKRLQTAHRVWYVLTSASDDYIARAWFIGLNPRLGEQEPAIAIRDDQLQDVLEAAKAFAEGSTNP